MKTTIYVHNSTNKKLSKAAKILSCSKSSIIKYLLKQVLFNTGSKSNIYKSIKYQPSDSKSNWDTFPIAFTNDEYEYYTDIRKVKKMSVSLALAIGCRIFLMELLIKKENEKRQTMLNYILKPYKLSIEIIPQMTNYNFETTLTKKCESMVIQNL